MDWYTAAQVTIDNGSKLVTVNSGEFIDAIREGDSFKISGFDEVEILETYTDETTDNEMIKLKKNWPNASQALVAATVIPNAVYFNTAAQALVSVKEKVFAQLNTFNAFATQANGNVTFKPLSELQPDITIKCLKQWDSELTALANSAGDSVDDLAAVDAAINTPETGLADVVSNMDATLQGYVTSASDDATKAQQYAVNPYGVDVTGTTDKSSLHYATDSNAAKVLAEQAKSQTDGLKSDVVTLKSQTESVYNSAFALSDTAVDVEISTGVYSLKHYLTKTQEAAATAQSAVASVTASLYFVGQWNASANTEPPPPAIINGVPQGNPMYKVTVAGIIDGVDYEPNDNIIWDSQNSTHDGTNWTLEKWFKVDNSESVVSVNSKQGVVVLNIADIPGLQSAIDTVTNTANSKVAQAEYDTHVAAMTVEINRMRTNLNCKLWGFII